MKILHNHNDDVNSSIRLLHHRHFFRMSIMKTKTALSAYPATIENLSQTQRERLAYIDFRLYFFGEAGRQDLMQRFGIAPAVATRDFAQYRETFPDNIFFDGTTKTYVIGHGFLPAFNHLPERVFTALSHGFGEGGGSVSGSLVTCELPLVLIHPSMTILAPISRAIHQKKVITMGYHSHTSGFSTREIVPFALVNTGLRWHVRAFDRKSNEFRDFVFTRMEKPAVIEGEPIQHHEMPSADIQWNRIVELDLVPHPNQDYPQTIEGDYGMVDGILHIKLRAAIAGYVLRQWIVDCSPRHGLKGKEYQLWLKNPLALYGVSNAVLAPGYEAPT